MKKLILFTLSVSIFCGKLFAQYPGPAGTAGSTAISADSSVFVAWATQCVAIRGWQDISDTALGRTTAGNESATLGKPDAGGTLSLGDGGVATVSFDVDIADKPGPDFAVFENSFDNTFLELAFVEVSSDGISFVRFPSISLTSDTIQIGTFGTVDATKVHNLAGKYRAGYGVPFDLAELTDTSLIDIHEIRYVRVIDVVGSIDSAYFSHDSNGNIINDPFPTPFPTGGFDLSGVGVIHTATGIEEDCKSEKINITVLPNASKQIVLTNHSGGNIDFRIFSITGQCLQSGKLNRSASAISQSLCNGVYIIRLFSEKSTISKKVLIR
ncbi:MAG: T9SS type A sorting domain-containing protein [Bacteroidetes bacterium]|nr:T9SS type A sorting domain-containing protein [Bacteroidota bacterium]MBU1720607.1 T9SS type A sorting domain-containing protein [Bacteroidota bacterium]